VMIISQLIYIVMFILWPLVSVIMIMIWMSLGLFLYQSKVICIGPVWNYWITKWIGIDHHHYPTILKGDNDIDFATLNKSLLAEFMIETLPQLIIQSVNTVLTNGVSATFIFSITLSIYNTINGVWKYGYYVLYLGKSVTEVPQEIEMLGGFIKSSYNPANNSNNNTNNNNNSNNITPPEVEARKLILESGSAEIIDIIIINKLTTPADLRDVRDVVKENILEKYKTLKSSSEYDHLKGLFDHFDVHHRRSIFEAGYELVNNGLSFA